MGFREWVRDRLVTADAIYGLILYAALVGASSDDDTPDAVVVLVVSLASLLIFWGAHVFAGTIANHGENVPLRRAMVISMNHSSGMLYAAILPSVPLLMAAFGVIDGDAGVDFALLIAMLILGVLGYSSFAQRKAHMAVRIFGAIGTALFGLLVIILNMAAH